MLINERSGKKKSSKDLTTLGSGKERKKGKERRDSNEDERAVLDKNANSLK